MNRFSPLLRVATILFFCAAGGYAQTIFQSAFRQPTYHNLYRIAFTDATHMYAVGDGATFARTTNGGSTMAIINVSTGYESLLGADFQSAQQGAVCGDRGLVAMTTDSGTNWTTHTVPGAGTLIGVVYDFSNGEGAVVSDSGRVFYTHDAGATWDPTLDLNSDPLLSNAERFVAACRVGASSIAAITNSGGLWKSTSDGATWDSIGPTRMANAARVFFLNDSLGWILNSSNKSNAWTTNGGRTWFQGSLQGGGTFGAVSFYNATNGFVLFVKPSQGGTYCGLYASTDGGQSFTQGPSIGDSVAALNDLRVDGTSGIGWAVGNAGDLRRSLDTGQTWQRLGVGGSGQTRAMSFWDDTHGVVCTYFSAPSVGGYNFYTSNGGGTWNVSQRLGENSLLAVHMTSATGAAAILQEARGYCFYTTSGTSWATATESGTSGSQYSRIAETPSGNLFACGDQGVMSFSSDAGKTWTQKSPDDLALSGINLRGVCFTDDLHGFACGTYAFYGYTTDGGLSWTQNIDFPAFNLDLTDIAFPTSTSGWVVTDSDGAVFHTNDGGATWDPYELGAHDTLSRVVFATAQLGWIGGSGGQLYMTSDGGATWRPVPTGTSNAITEINYTPRTNPDLLWLSGGAEKGGSGMVLKGDFTPLIVRGASSATHPGGYAMNAVYPNPIGTSGRATVAYSLDAATSVDLDVVNVLGDHVRTLQRGARAAGPYTATWDGRDERGASVPPGAYFIALTAGGVRTTRALAVTR